MSFGSGNKKAARRRLVGGVLGGKRQAMVTIDAGSDAPSAPAP